MRSAFWSAESEALPQRRASWFAENEALPQHKALWSAESEAKKHFSFKFWLWIAALLAELAPQQKVTTTPPPTGQMAIICIILVLINHMQTCMECCPSSKNWSSLWGSSIEHNITTNKTLLWTYSDLGYKVNQEQKPTKLFATPMLFTLCRSVENTIILRNHI